MITRQEIIRRKFWEFYNESGRNIIYPSRIEEREFGFIAFREGMMSRHKGFKSHVSLGEFIRAMVPSDVYYSTAYYQRPEEDMDKKGWKGADLCFDIDADHLNTKCRQNHDSWKCLECGEGGFGEAPKACPKCKGKRFEEKNWFCKECLEASKEETVKLLELLMTDFGLPSSKLDVCFSGHRGYHVHVEDEGLIGLGQLARKEIVDYVMGCGLNLGYYGFPSEGKSGNIITNFDQNGYGWNIRLNKYLHDYLLGFNEGMLREAKGREKLVVKTILDNKEEILNDLFNRATLKTFEGVNVKTWKKIVEAAIRANSINIDTVVTIDIHRLIRLPLTLHRKTGLKAVVVPAEDLRTFDPFADAVAFNEGFMNIRVSNVQKFEIARVEYGPYKDETVELPSAAAMLLLCKGLADPV